MLLLNVVAFLAIPFLAFAKIIMGPFTYSQGTFTVSWTAASDAPPSFDILLRKGAQRIPLVTEISSSLGSYTYALPSTTPPGDNYKIQFVVHDPTDPTPEILDTSPAFSVQQTDFNGQTGSLASTATASVSSVSSVSGASVTASISSESGSSVTASLASSLQSSVSTALGSLTATMPSGVVTTVTSGSVIYTTTINPIAATVSAISQSIATATSSAAAAASSSVTPSAADALIVNWAGIGFSVAAAIVGAAIVL